jgi:hypothetical protein
MKLIVIVVFILIALAALLFQSAGFSRKTSFTGATILSLCLGALLWINHASYLVVTVTFFMLLADLSVHFFSRSIAILPDREKQSAPLTKLYRSFVTFFLACWTIGVSAIIWTTKFDETKASSGEGTLSAFHSLLWMDGFLFIAVVTILILVASFGVFFMAKKES